MRTYIAHIQIFLMGEHSSKSEILNNIEDAQKYVIKQITDYYKLKFNICICNTDINTLNKTLEIYNSFNKNFGSRICYYIIPKDI